MHSDRSSTRADSEVSMIGVQQPQKSPAGIGQALFAVVDVTELSFYGDAGQLDDPDAGLYHADG